jgi:HAMP domain-containing protein
LELSVPAVYLVDENGRAIYHSDFGLTGSDLSGADAVQRVLTSGVGALRTISGAGEDVVAAYAPVPGTPWSLVSEVSWSSLTKASRDYQQFLLALLALGILVPVVIVGIGIRRLMRPVDELIAAARAVGAGDLSRRIESPAGDEIGVLATSFNQMTGQVADRTRELRVLEELGLAIVNGPSDASTLAEVLADYIPAMVPDGSIEVRIYPDRTLYRGHEAIPEATASAWAWLAAQPAARHVEDSAPLGHHSGEPRHGGGADPGHGDEGADRRHPPLVRSRSRGGPQRPAGRPVTRGSDRLRAPWSRGLRT